MMNLEKLLNILSMGNHGIYIWVVLTVLLLLLSCTYFLLDKKIAQAKKEINEEG